jgi:excisionase family DNA binding protein
MKRVLTVPEAAAELGITARAVWQRVYRGQLPHHRNGRRVYLLQDELDRFLKESPGTTVEEALARAEQGR